MSTPPSSRGAFVDGAMRRRATREAVARARTASVAPVTETARVGSNARASTSGNARERSTMTTASERARARELGLETPRPGSSLLRGWLAQDYDWTRETVTSELTGNESTEHSLAVQKSYEPELSAPKTVARWFGGRDPTAKEALTASTTPALWNWLCASSMEGWRRNIAVLGAIVGQSSSMKGKPIIFGTGSSRKTTFLYNVRSNKTMDIELTQRGEALFDYMIANMLLMQATARAKYSPIMFPFMHKFRPKAYMTLAGLPRDWEGWRLHQILARRMEESGRVVEQRPDAPITIVPMSEIEISSYEGSIPPQLFVWALPPLHNSLENRKLIERDIQTALRLSKTTDVRVVVCGLEFAGHRGSNVSVGDQWGEFMTDLSNATRSAAVSEHNSRFADQLDTIQHQWLNEWSHNGLTLPEVTKMMAGGELDNYGEMTSARARKWFDEYTAPYLGKQHDSRWFLMNAIFGGLRFINRLRSRTRSFGDSIVDTTQHTHKFLRGEMTNEEILEEERKLIALHATAEGRAKLFPPVTKIFDALRDFRSAVRKADLRAELKDLTAKANDITSMHDDTDIVKAEVLLREMWNTKGKISEASLPQTEAAVVAFNFQLGKLEQIAALGEMHRQAFLDTIKRINEFVENPMPVEGGPQALEAQSVEMEELINELSSRVQARLAGSALQVSHDKLDELSEDDISNELMDALQIDADDVEIAGRASQLGRERVAALAAARDLLHAAEDVDPVKLRERIAQAKEASVDENIILAAETKLENLERQIQAFIRAHRITDSLLPAPTSGSDSDSDRWVNAGRNIWYNEAEILGRGSLGTVVFKGFYDEGAGNRVVRRDAAIKRIPLPPGERGENMKSLIEREIAIHKHLNERSTRATHILGSTLDVERGDGAIYTAMELCGESLATWLKNAGTQGGAPAISHTERMDAVRQLAYAVEDVHAAGVTHNDIKADNCLRSADGDFKLADLGLGVRLKDVNKATDGNTYSLTTFEGYGVNIGLQGRPPEVLLNAPLTPKVDVWSFGCLMYTIMTGFQSPYKQEKKMDTSKKTRTQEIDLSASTALDVGFENQRIVKGKFSLQALETAMLPAHTTVAAREVLHRMLDPDPRERPSAAEVCEHPVLWDVEECMEAVRETFDRRIVSALSEKEEAELAQIVWKGRPGQAERAAQSIRNWKSLVVPSLLTRAEKYVQRTADMQQSWTEVRAAKAAATAPKVKGRNRRGGRRQVEAQQSTKQHEPKDYSYGDRLFDLVRFTRNMHEHPPLEAERAEMLRALGPNVSLLLRPEDTNADPWTSSRKIVEAYFAHTFPDLPLFAHYLLKRESATDVSETN